MWLINCQSLNLEEFVKDVPPYAILSHTWGDEEVAFIDMSNQDKVSKKEGYQKIEATCRVALEHDLNYAWVDTCCIDKSSSAELSEAINSMFAWYKKAVVCFVWLCDFASFPDKTLAEAITSFESREALEAKGEGFYGDLPQQTAAEIDLRNRVKKRLGNCKWFSRGWTLQELIAPSRINFYDKEWNYFGSKLELACVLSWITGVDTSVLKGRPLDEILVGRRMSWASTRTTTRVEDIAYCLLGIFDINIPLLYGEGEKAFIRLQEEIIRSSHDLSIFAWKADVNDLRRFRGLMANSPAEFKGCQRLVKPSFEWNNGGEYGLTSRGLRTDGLIRVGRGEADQAGSYFMSLGCVDERQRKLVLAVSLRQYGPGLFARRKPWPMTTVFDLNVYSAAKLAHPQYICCKDNASLEDTVMNSRINAIQIRFSDSIFDIDSITVFPQADWDLRNSILLSFQRPYYWGMWKVKVRDRDDGISIVCVRSSGWLLYGIFASNRIPSALTRDDLLPSHVEDILQRLPDRTSTECSGFIHTVKDGHLNLGETGMEIPATLLQVESIETKQSRTGMKLMRGLFRKNISIGQF
ncbi:HET-domain-containing protein [Annulohypoxylon maeteangense]|uniref:HET-domain-containing protein n=1 Tax=Annulohypoxylon maeteangense TaxID=1927788 RepID=UPI002008B54D|nr:HET-domain-containing protein [Annulohypoxylon maeteangense]KAI0879990.1 HET-domain-containing protein [Annulohypoxylon maeteangense]